MAKRIGAGPEIVIETETSGWSRANPAYSRSISSMRVNRDSALPDLAKNSVRPCADPIKRRTIKGSAQSFTALVPGQIMESRVSVFGQTQTSEQPRRFFAPSLSPFPGFPSPVRFAEVRFQVLLRISSGQIRKFAGQSFVPQESAQFLRPHPGPVRRAAANAVLSESR